jgi:hypothetical protein
MAVITLPIGVIQMLCSPSPGHSMDNISSLEAMIIRPRSGMPSLETMSSPIGAIRPGCSQSPGHLTGHALPQVALIQKCKCGKHPDFGHTLRLACEKNNTLYNSEESTTAKGSPVLFVIGGKHTFFRARNLCKILRKGRRICISSQFEVEVLQIVEYSKCSDT